ncbi:hypothetical protein AQUCO_00400502v1 [Aquilegia coerulea]|uniref:Stress response protein nst1 n=1 Tax=Aquilegia coerulea TaxID=218851 RepID=A0A2G5EV90_AQUCA|nr:hypothetical protein AQUCO_00400502v1 [Aquilegia coerulea]PIA59646.1 hypothetical protein AQUCO_00400502v1 [Aquilegia coerulea]
MCILCVVQKWSRRVATMLPWLLFPLLGLWVFSHLLPPGFRFEFTSPRIACVLVLLVTIFWYEVLMPQLSAWRARNSAKYREMRRREAIEMQKLRKIATRLCRNCLTPYRDQNPGGGKFMCSYCGHISKRPVLDIPGNSPSGNGLDVDSKGVRKECTGISCIFGNDVSQNENSTRGPFALRSNCRGKNGGEASNGDDQCFATKFCVSASKTSNRIFSKFRRFWRNIFGLASEDDGSSDGDNEDMLYKEGENGLGFHESRGEKARRKAEEKRQARLEREQLEEEERKQREEVAKLVEEQRRLRDEKMEAEKECVKGTVPDKEKSSKREAEKKRQERRREKDKGSSKSNSDCEDIDRKIGKDNDKKREFDKKSDSGRRELQKTANLGVKARNSEAGNASKVGTMHNTTRGGGTRYLERVKGSFMSSSKAFNSASFFGKGAHASANGTSKAGNHLGAVDHIQTASSWREVHSADHVHAKISANGDVSKINSYQTVASEIQPQTTQKKSWRQLFTRSPAVPPSTENFVSGSNQKFQSISKGSYLPGQSSPSHPLADQISFGLPLPFSLSPFPNGSTGSSPIASSVAEPIYPHFGEPLHDFMSEEPDIFEDPCYVPDPVSLLGPVSESLDNFSLDVGTGLMRDFERPLGLKNLSPSLEVNKPSPIEAPVSRLRFVEERNTNYSSYPSTPKSQNVNSSPFNGSSNDDDEGTWKMWSTPPLGHDGFGLIGGSGSWLSPIGQKKTTQEEVFHPSGHNAVGLQFPNENQVRSGTSSPQRLPVGNFQNGGNFCSLAPGSNDNDPWLQRNVFQPLPGDGQDHFPPLVPWEDISQKQVPYCGSSNSSPSHPSELSSVNRWPKKDCAVNGAGRGDGNPLVARPHIGGLFSTPDVQSLWSYN